MNGGRESFRTVIVHDCTKKNIEKIIAVGKNWTKEIRELPENPFESELSTIGNTKIRLDIRFRCGLYLLNNNEKMSKIMMNDG